MKQGRYLLKGKILTSKQEAEFRRSFAFSHSVSAALILPLKDIFDPLLTLLVAMWKPKSTWAFVFGRIGVTMGPISCLLFQPVLKLISLMTGMFPSYPAIISSPLRYSLCLIPGVNKMDDSSIGPDRCSSAMLFQARCYSLTSQLFHTEFRGKLRALPGSARVLGSPTDPDPSTSSGN